jgi:hypothetical protein
LLCDGARDGTSGDDVETAESRRSSKVEADRRGDFLEPKLKRELDALDGVLDGGFDTSVNVVSRERCEPAEESESSAELRDDVDDTEFEALRCARIVETSGALYTSMLVADTRAIGPDIVRMSTGLSELRMLFARRGIVGGIVVSERLERRVKALVIDMLGKIKRFAAAEASSTGPH